MSSRHSKGISVDQALSFAQQCSGAKRKLMRNYVKVGKQVLQDSSVWNIWMSFDFFVFVLLGL